MQIDTVDFGSRRPLTNCLLYEFQSCKSERPTMFLDLLMLIGENAYHGLPNAMQSGTLDTPSILTSWTLQTFAVFKTVPFVIWSWCRLEHMMTLCSIRQFHTLSCFSPDEVFGTSMQATKDLYILKLVFGPKVVPDFLFCITTDNRSFCLCIA